MHLPQRHHLVRRRSGTSNPCFFPSRSFCPPWTLPCNLQGNNGRIRDAAPTNQHERKGKQVQLRYQRLSRVRSPMPPQAGQNPRPHLELLPPAVPMPHAGTNTELRPSKSGHTHGVDGLGSCWTNKRTKLRYAHVGAFPWVA